MTMEKSWTLSPEIDVLLGRTGAEPQRLKAQVQLLPTLTHSLPYHLSGLSIQHQSPDASG